MQLGGRARVGADPAIGDRRACGTGRPDGPLLPRGCCSEADGPSGLKAGARGAGTSPTPRRSRCMTGAVRGGPLPWHRAEVALRPCGPADRRSNARAWPAPVAAAPPRAADVRPPADPAYRHTCASRRGPCRSHRRVARRRAARADPGVLTLKPGSTAGSIRHLTRLRLTRVVGPDGRSHTLMGDCGSPVYRHRGCGRQRRYIDKPAVVSRGGELLVPVLCGGRRLLNPSKHRLPSGG